MIQNNSQNPESGSGPQPGASDPSGARAGCSAAAPKNDPAASSKDVPADKRPGPARRFPSVGDLFAMLGIAFAAQIVVGVFGVIFTIFASGGPDHTKLDATVQGGYLAVTYIVSMALALGGILSYRRARGGTGPVAHFSRRGLNPLLLVWCCAFMFAAGIVFEPLLSLLPQPSTDMFGRGFWSALTLILFAPLFEETMCRGVVLGSVRAKYGVVAAWIASSLFFAVLHLQPLLVVNALIIGLILGFVYLATDSLWAPIILHAANNAVAYLLMASGHEETMLIDLVGNRTWYAVVYIAAVAVAFISARMAWSTLSRLKAAEKKAAEA